MNEYIAREALMAKAVYMHGFGKNKYVPLRAIESAPAADVVEVVRCKDCKLRHSSEFCECRDDMAFCSDGERRGNDGQICDV